MKSVFVARPNSLRQRKQELQTKNRKFKKLKRKTEKKRELEKKIKISCCEIFLIYPTGQCLCLVIHHYFLTHLFFGIFWKNERCDWKFMKIGNIFVFFGRFLHENEHFSCSCCQGKLSEKLVEY